MNGEESSEEEASLIQPLKKIKGNDAGLMLEKGKYKHEVTLRFDDGVEYYLPEDFFKMASPVFTKMLEADFKEKQEMVIDLKGKSSADFLELLNYLHPAVHKRITEDAVFKIIPLAEEYIVKSAVEDCINTLKDILKELQEKKKPSPWVNPSHWETLIKCFDILEVAMIYSYRDVETLAVSVISKYPSAMYLRNFDNEDLGVEVYVNMGCFQRFVKLQEKAKNKIFEERLKECDARMELGGHDFEAIIKGYV